MSLRERVEIFKKHASMSEEIVTYIDPEYGYYAGASLEIAGKMAMLDTIVANQLIPDAMLPFVKLYRDLLNRQRKAFFASVGSTEITKLGFIKGDRHKVVNANDKATMQ